MKPLGLFPIFSYLLAMTVFAGEPQTKCKFQLPHGKVLVIVGQNLNSVDDYVVATGIIPGGVMTYTSIQNLDGLETPHTESGVTQHAQSLVDHYPESVVQIGLYMVNALEKVIGGQYDENIRHLGEWIKATKRPVFLRIGYEFDGMHNHYDPVRYVQAYRHIVDLFRKNDVQNAAYVWHSFGSATVSQSPAPWFPGDAYVDWFAISYFDQPQSLMMPMVKLAKEHHKPLMLAESTPKGSLTSWGKGTWDGWFKPYFEFVKEHHVQAICYINDNWNGIEMWKGQNWGDSRIEKSTYIREKWLNEIRKNSYLHAFPGLFTLLGYAPN